MRRVIILAGLGWSLAFVLAGLAYGLQMYADGSIFSYSIAVEDAWAYHWHNISGRLFVYAFSHAPAEIYVHLTGDPSGGIVLYGLLHFAAQMLGLAGTWLIDRSAGRVIFVFACLSTACLCPLVFGFPTEMWLSHALFWPALAACHYASPGIAGIVIVFALLQALLLTHEGAVIFAAAIVASTVIHGLRDPRVARSAAALGVALVTWAGIKWAIRPDPYASEVLASNALNFIDVGSLACSAMLLPIAAVAGYAAARASLRRLGVENANSWAAGAVAVALAAYWIHFDALNADSRYYLRTALLVATPVLGALAAIAAVLADGSDLPLFVPESLQCALAALPRRMAPRSILAGFLLVMLVHAVENAKFVHAWNSYKSAVLALATDQRSDPALGNPAFVSSARLDEDLNRLSWFSTTQYLSVLVAPGFAPSRLVVDPDQGYFWISCDAARRNERSDRAVPVASRKLVRMFVCLHGRGDTSASR